MILQEEEKCYHIRLEVLRKISMIVKLAVSYRMLGVHLLAPQEFCPIELVTMGNNFVNNKLPTHGQKVPGGFSLVFSCRICKCCITGRGYTELRWFWGKC
jgi:hypothetical protein